MNIKEAYKQGFIDGLTAYAWWKDGTQYVGSKRTRLHEAIEQIEKTFNYNPPKEKVNVKKNVKKQNLQSKTKVEKVKKTIQTDGENSFTI